MTAAEELEELAGRIRCRRAAAILDQAVRYLRGDQRALTEAHEMKRRNEHGSLVRVCRQCDAEDR